MLDVAASVSSSPRLHHSIRQPVHGKDCRQVSVSVLGYST